MDLTAGVLCFIPSIFMTLIDRLTDCFHPSCSDQQSHFISALTVVFVNSKSLSSLKIDDTPVDDPSLKVLVANNSDTLKLLKMSSCPHVSPAGSDTQKLWSHL